MNAHLTDVQMLELLQSDAAAPAATPNAAPHTSPDPVWGAAPDADATRDHLATCAACQSELAGLIASLENFRAATSGFAAAHAPTFVPRIAQPPVRPSLFSFGRQGWAASFATAGVLALVSISVVHARHESQQRDSPPSSAATQTAVTTSGETDEALLDGIERDLSTSIPPSLRPLALPAAKAPKSH